MSTPTDPLYSSQWHFPLIGDIETIWNEYTGSGVNIGIYDDGVQYTHTDLDDNYDASLHVEDLSDNPVDPSPNLINNDSHGTAVAGIIGAENNGDGVVGVAYGSTLTGVNIFDSGTYGYINSASSTAFMDVVDQASSLFDISSNSWGSTPLYGSSQNYNGIGFSNVYVVELAQNSASGRGGLGTITVQAAGNDALDANGSGDNASRHTITVAATDASGDVQSYSNFGSSILISAPAAGYTTDLIGEDGYNGTGDNDPATDLDFTSEFGGTSAATPVISGVIALMLEANSGLGWRDVQNILAISASHTGSDYGASASGFEVEAWDFNSADTWNGGGISFNGSYGYGMVDAFAAVRMAEAWEVIFDAAQTSANEQSGTAYNGANFAIPDANTTGVSITVNSFVNLTIEHIELNLTFDHTYVGDLSIFITDPDGNEMQIVFPGNVDTTVTDGWSYGIDSFMGVNSFGNWVVRVVDNFGADIGTIYDTELVFFGTTPDNDDVYHYTNDLEALLALDASRAVLSDTNGGNDWVNLSAISEDVSINLANNGTGGGTRISDSATLVSIASGTLIENVISGDGDDIIQGNNAANELFGMRGDDVIKGGAGADTIDGGANGANGDTASYEGSSARVIVDLSGGGSASGGHATGDELINIENLTGSNYNDLLTGSSDDNVLEGSGGADTLRGLEGDDTLNGGNGNDTLFGGGSDDTLNGGSGRDTIYGNSGEDDINGGTGLDTIYSGSGEDDVLGGTGNDYINGQGENDILNGQGGNDEIIGGGGNDTIYGGADNDDLYGSGNNDDLFGQSGNDYLSGAAGVDELFGGSGDDTLLGGTGGDRLDGGTGDDTMNGGADGNRDVFVFSVGYDEDRINGFEQTGNDRIELDEDLWLASHGTLTSQQVVDTFGSMNAAGNILTLDFGNGDILEIQQGAGIDDSTIGSDILIV